MVDGVGVGSRPYLVPSTPRPYRAGARVTLASGVFKAWASELPQAPPCTALSGCRVYAAIVYRLAHHKATTDDMICYGIAVAVLGACAPAPLAGACLQPPHPCSPLGGGVFLGGLSLATPRTPQPSVFHSWGAAALGSDRPRGRIFAPFLSMNSLNLSTFGRFLSALRSHFSCFCQIFFVTLQYIS